jgi:lysophospholipase L1-like esterase
MARLAGIGAGLVVVTNATAAGFWLPPSFGGNNPNLAVAVGDSITLGTLADGQAAQPYPLVLQSLLASTQPGFVVANRGVGGETTAAGLARLPEVLAEDRPGFVLIMEGTNDATHGVSPDVIVANLRAMIQLVKAHFAVPILAMIIPNHRSFAGEAKAIIGEVNARLPGVAAAEGVRLVNTFGPMNNHGLYGSDDLHPTQQGYQVLAAAWRPGVAAAITDARPLLEGFSVSSGFDFDADARADLVVYRRTTGEWFIHHSSNGALVTVQWGNLALGDIPVPADYDGDGRADVAVYRPSTGEWFILHSSDDSIHIETFGSAPFGDMPVPADYDGDGAADLAVFRQTTGEWLIFGSTAGLIGPTPFGAPSLGDLPVPRDFDGDGRADLAVYRFSTGEWFIFGSSSGLETRLFGAPAFTGLGDVPVPADYDGDAIADLAVFRHATGEWFIFGSSTGFATRPFGAPAFTGLGDVPIAADYDGDSRVDTAVYRGTTGQWFVLLSSNGQVGTTAYGAPLLDAPLTRAGRVR